MSDSVMGPGPRSGADAGAYPVAGVDAPALTDMVRLLSDEISGLRSASRLRAVIEQAKGVLVERHHITLEEAFAQLRRMSQQHNVRLVEVAATIVGVAVPEAPADAVALPEDILLGRLPASEAASGTWLALRRRPGVRAGVASALIDSVAGAATRGDEAARLLLDLLAPDGVAAVTLFRSSADESLRLVGQHGVPGDVISSWRSIPPLRDIPYIRAVRDNTSYFWGDKAERAAHFPSIGSGQTTFQASAVVTVSDGGAVVGIVGLLWEGPQQFDEERRRAITGLVQRVGPMLLRNVAAEDPELGWLNTVLRLHLDPWLLIDVPPGDGATAQEYVVRDAAPTLPVGADWVGRRLAAIWPSAAQDAVISALGHLATAGGSHTLSVEVVGEAPWAAPGTRVRAVRLGRRIVLVWRPGPGGDGTTIVAGER